MGHGLKALTLVALMSACAVSTGVAAVVTVDFDDVPETIFQPRNFESQGFRFSPCNDYAITSNNPIYPSEPASPEWQGYLGTQFFSFQSAFGNPDYLGDETSCNPHVASNSLLYIDNGGRPFSLESLYGVLVMPNMQVLSSKGGNRGIGGLLRPRISLDT